MKVQHLFLAFATASLLLTACKEEQIMPGDNDHNQKGLEIEIPDTNGIVIDVDSAILILIQCPLATATSILRQQMQRLLAELIATQ